MDEEWEVTRRRDDATEELPSLLRQASRAMDHLLRETFERHGLAELTLTGHDVLVAARGGRPVVALADRLFHWSIEGDKLRYIESSGDQSSGPHPPPSSFVSK